MKILISDIWSVYNSGDRAILEGLLDGLRAMYPDAELTIAAHFPEGCEAIAGVRVLPDVLAFDEGSLQAQMAAVDGLDARLDALKAAYRGSDLVVSTGGYFLNATPGNPFGYVFLSRLLHFNWARDVGVPVAVLGQSLGPIESAGLRLAARSTFARIPLIGARDLPSFSWMHRTGVAPHTVLTADLAVDLAPAPAAEVERLMKQKGWPRGALGISVRHYAGTPESAFRDMARVADEVIRHFKVPVLLIGTTVPPANLPGVQKRERELGNDDSIALQQVYQLMQEKSSAAVCTESLPPRLLKGVLGTCRAFLSTRMHAAILASTAGVPVGGIAYEFKVTGWFERLGLPDLVLPLSEMNQANLWRLACRLLTDTKKLETHLARVIPEIQSKARLNFEHLAKLCPVTGKIPTVSASAARGPQAWTDLIAPAYDPVETKVRVETTPVKVTALPQEATVTVPIISGSGLAAHDPRRVWEKESAHYDVFHRRLRKIVELAEQIGGSRLLDIGCSAGTVGAALSPAWNYHGCDVSESAVRSAHRGWLVPADLERGIPRFDEQPYDVVVCSGILEYLERPQDILRQIQCRLRPGGQLIVSYFNMRHVSRKLGAAYRHPLWRNDFTPAEFRALLLEAGWEINTTTWSTAGLNSAPDVRDEEQAVRNEPADAAARIDELAHTLIYVARPKQPVEVVASQRLPVSVVMPAFNRHDLLEPVLKAFAGLEASVPFEVVVVDDGSEVPVKIEGWGDRFRLHRQENRGRGAAINAGIDAARGEVVVICDSDILPDKNFIEDHWGFHRKNRAEGATHLGELVWGVDSGPLGEILGARANPRLIGHRGPVDWTIWYTDNWSFKRSLFDRHAFRFDPAFKKWGWEEIELASRLSGAGATNFATGSAVGRHLKPIALDGMLRNFAHSVPNLVRLARQVGPKPEVICWLGFRMASPVLLAACEQVLRLAVTRIESLWSQAELGADISRLVSTDVSNAIFACGIESGFQALPAPALTGLTLKPANDAERVMNYCEVVGDALLLEAITGQTSDLQERAGAIFAPFVAGKLSSLFLQRAQHRVRQCAMAHTARP